jgi:hypothetical protein
LRGCSISLGKWSCCWVFPGLILTCNSMISYPNYKFIFPIKALGMYAKRFGDDSLL